MCVKNDVYRETAAIFQFSYTHDSGVPVAVTRLHAGVTCTALYIHTSIRSPCTSEL